MSVYGKSKKGIFSPGKQSQGTAPSEFWEKDFIEVKTELYGYNHVLVFVDGQSVS